MRILLHIFIWIGITVSFFSCQKDAITKSYIDYSTSTDHDFNEIYFVNNSEAIILGGTYWDKGLILHTTDGGNNWIQDSFSNKSIISLSIDNNHNLYTAGPEGYIHKKNAADTIWSRLKIDPWEVLTDVSFYNHRGIVTNGVAYERGKLYFIENNILIDTSKTYGVDFQSVHMSSEDEIQLMGYGIIMYSPDFGTSWDTIDISGDFYYDMSFISPNIGFGLGLQGSVLSTTNAGKDWTVLRTPHSFSNQTYKSIYFIDSKNGFICGDKGLVEITKNGGKNWHSIFELPKLNFNNMTYKGSDLFVVGDNGTLIKIKNILD